MPGKALKLDEAQKKVSSHSGTWMQLGSGWKPGRMGLRNVELLWHFPRATGANAASPSTVTAR